MLNSNGTQILNLFCWFPFKNGHPITKHLAFQNLDVSDHKQAFFSPPFDNRTKIYHYNFGLVRYSDGYCILMLETGLDCKCWVFKWPSENQTENV